MMADMLAAVSGDDATGSPTEATGAETTPAKERHSLTLDQRRALRRWANSQMVRPSHKACIEWFSTQYGQTISQSTVSHSLSPKYARLDGDPQLSGSRLRFGNWPDVEKLVLLWHSEMANRGRHPTNEELAEKAKSIFTQLPRYKGEEPPEFSPGWIHRFKKRYGLLMRRQRRNGAAPDPAHDIPYLVDAVPRFMAVAADTSPAVIRDAIERIIGVECSLVTCARVRDEVIRRLEQGQTLPHQQQQQQAPPPHMANIAAAAAAAAAVATGNPNGGPDDAGQQPQQQQQQVGGVSPDDDPEVALQNALRAMQQEEAEAEAVAAAEREDRDRAEQGLPPLSRGGSTMANGASPGGYLAQHQQQHHQMGTPTPGGARMGMHHHSPSSASQQQQHHHQGYRPSQHEDLTLTPIPSAGPVSSIGDRPVRCPFCVNSRMLRTIKEAVEHMSTHVVV